MTGRLPKVVRRHPQGGAAEALAPRLSIPKYLKKLPRLPKRLLGIQDARCYPLAWPFSIRAFGWAHSLKFGWAHSLKKDAQ